MGASVIAKHHDVLQTTVYDELSGKISPIPGCRLGDVEAGPYAKVAIVSSEWATHAIQFTNCFSSNFGRMLLSSAPL
jgi:hypothetical protein